MADDWFYAAHGQQFGPVNFASLQGIAAAGNLQPGDLVWQQGMPNWAPASTVPGLFQAPAAPVPPPPPPPQPMNYPPPPAAGGYPPPPGYAPAPLRPIGDAMTMMAFEANKKSIGLAYVLWFFFGVFGAQRFYLRRPGAVAMLILSIIGWSSLHVGVGFVLLTITGIWAIVDAFLIPAWIFEWNTRLLAAMAAAGQQIR
jgi:TM2 domain-containing membrane protein YozV